MIPVVLADTDDLLWVGNWRMQSNVGDRDCFFTGLRIGEIREQ